ncbi:MAG: hypothetical protein IE928_11050 [Gammaproteobacteria bacterium]|nr:hypothetical protein [Gammaproteobacteria bacterium]MBD3822842.1 hypothetical protein [Thiotrichales bacterium]
MKASNEFEKWALGYSGCDGGDIGSRSSPAIWVCGIEWGGGHTPEALITHMEEDVNHPPKGYADWKENLAYIFNRQVMKMLSAINGGSVSEYKEFAERVQPFVDSRRGYFKMNLYPIGFKDTSYARWHDNFSAITGFQSKADYLAWCSNWRFPQLRKWAEQAAPKLILCLGKTYIDDFQSAFHDDGCDFTHEVIDDRDLFWGVNTQGSTVAVVPFMVNRNGLVKNTSIQKFGERIAQLLTNAGKGRS